LQVVQLTICYGVVIITLVLRLRVVYRWRTFWSFYYI